MEYAIETILFSISMVARLVRMPVDSRYLGVTILPPARIPCKQAQGQHTESNRLIPKRDLRPFLATDRFYTSDSIALTSGWRCRNTLHSDAFRSDAHTTLRPALRNPVAKPPHAAERASRGGTGRSGSSWFSNSIRHRVKSLTVGVRRPSAGESLERPIGGPAIMTRRMACRSRPWRRRYATALFRRPPTHGGPANPARLRRRQPNAVTAARERWRKLKDAGHDPTYWAQTESGGWRRRG